MICYIYKLLDMKGFFYIGSTHETLHTRFSQHKTAAMSKKYKVYNYFNQNGWENVKIILLETVECTTREDKRKQEQKFIEPSINDERCLNTNYAFRSDERLKAQQQSTFSKFIKLNPDRMKEFKKKDYEKHCEAYKRRAFINRQKNIEKLREKFTCPCGGRYAYESKHKHIKTQKHKRWENSNNL